LIPKPCISIGDCCFMVEYMYAAVFDYSLWIVKIVTKSINSKLTQYIYFA
jgi:hypothetical protein